METGPTSLPSKSQLPKLAPHLLVVDDDARLRTLLLRYLQAEGFAVSTVASAKEAAVALQLFQIDLMILDIMMPEVSGLEFLSAQTGASPPVLCLSAMGDAEHRIQGLERGAQDYLAKPFDPRELVLRIQTVLRRSGLQKEELSASVMLGASSFSPEGGYLQKGTERSFLPAAELTLLKILALSLNKPVSRETIATHLKEPSQLRTIDVQVNRLRQRIEEDPKHPQILLTVRGEGYLLRGKT